MNEQVIRHLEQGASASLGRMGIIAYAEANAAVNP